jgi:phosphoribosylglycinamide formyltransferase-1
MRKFAVMYSGYGRGAKEIVLAALGGYLKPELALIIATGKNRKVLDFTIESGLSGVYIDKSSYSTHQEFEACLSCVLIEYKIDYLFLAGYGFLIGPSLLMQFRKRIANIHPSLLPSFKGHKNGIQQALEYGVKLVGVTTHWVDAEMDSGEILMQEAIPVYDYDDFTSLEYRVFKIGCILQVQTINNYFI